jgi:DNA invertase Pin-like site-specific DNA recombinase
MTRAAIYGRFSTDLQRDRSVEDQFALCDGFAKREGLSIVRSYSDKAKSGASIFGRDGLLNLMEDARAGLFDAVVVEALDRISRDQEDLAGIYKRLSFAGVKLIAVHDGQADAVQIGVRGLLGSLFLADLAHKVRRGLQGVIRDGRHAGGKAYGYHPVPGKPGELSIDQAEAAVVRRIFTEYVEGASPRAIARKLNDEGILPPRGTVWNASTINGNGKRGTGILQNPLYAGEIIWNRVRMVRDPASGKRLSRVNPESEWHRAKAPHLRIIDDALFHAARERKIDNSHDRDPSKPMVKKPHLLSGLLRCGVCGSGMSLSGTDDGRRRVRCSRSKESGSCSNRTRFYLDVVEQTVIDNLASIFREPEVLDEYLRIYREEWRARTQAAVRNRDAISRGLADVKGQIDRMVKLYAKGVIDEARAERELLELRGREIDLSTELSRASSDVPVIELHADAVAEFRATVDSLALRLPQIAKSEAALAANFRKLIDAVVVHPGRPAQIEVVGKLAALIGKASRGGEAPALSMVAGDRSSRKSREVRGLLIFGPWEAIQAAGVPRKLAASL